MTIIHDKYPSPAETRQFMAMAQHRIMLPRPTGAVEWYDRWALLQIEPEQGVPAMSRTTRMRTLLASAARTADVNTDDQFMDPVDGHPIRGVIVTIDCTASADTPSVVFTIQGKDAVGTYYTVLASAAVTAASTTVLTVYPGITAAANEKADMPCPNTWRVNCNHADADSITYSVSADLLS